MYKTQTQKSNTQKQTKKHTHKKNPLNTLLNYSSQSEHLDNHH